MGLLSLGCGENVNLYSVDADLYVADLTFLGQTAVPALGEEKEAQFIGVKGTMPFLIHGIIGIVAGTQEGLRV